MKYQNVIWEGRFQPLHQGHLGYIGLLLEQAERVWIWVLASEESKDVVENPACLPVPDFTREVDPHHVPEKNIIPFWLRYLIVGETIKAEFGPDAPVTICGGRRLDLAWDLYKKILPPNRVFLTPEREPYEDVKARAWTTLGETCHRINVSGLPKISGTMIRERLAANLPVSGLLARKTEDLLIQYGAMDDLRRL